MGKCLKFVFAHLCRLAHKYAVAYQMQNLSGTSLIWKESKHRRAAEIALLQSHQVPPRHFLRLSEMEIKFSPKMNGREAFRSPTV